MSVNEPAVVVAEFGRNALLGRLHFFEKLFNRGLNAWSCSLNFTGLFLRDFRCFFEFSLKHREVVSLVIDQFEQFQVLVLEHCVGRRVRLDLTFQNVELFIGRGGIQLRFQFDDLLLIRFELQILIVCRLLVGCDQILLSVDFRLLLFAETCSNRNTARAGFQL